MQAQLAGGSERRSVAHVRRDCERRALQHLEVGSCCDVFASDCLGRLGRFLVLPLALMHEDKS
eukprot:12159830-Alexandrium_andersonii.AAC.1